MSWINRFATFLLSGLASLPLIVEGQSIRISGTVKNSEGASLSGARVFLKNANLADTTGADGVFLIQSAPIDVKANLPLHPNGRLAARTWGGVVNVKAIEGSLVSLRVFSQLGRELFTGNYRAEAKDFPVEIHGLGPDWVLVRIQSGEEILDLQANSRNGSIRATLTGVGGKTLRKASAGIPDSLVVTKDGFQRKAISITKADTTGIEIRLSAASNLPPFSFFITSLEAMRRLSKSQNGFGGDLRYGETGSGAGLRGADKICTEIAESSMPGSKAKQWRAYLSVNQGDNGQPVHAVERIGTGPWYDRLGRLVAQDRAGLLRQRPASDAAIANDLPNESGELNHDAGGVRMDNHDIVTGSDAQGRLLGNTCRDWTSIANDFTGSNGGGAGGNGPKIGHSWPASSGQHWLYSHNSPGCAPSVVSGGGSLGGTGIGDLGGYGGIYCFALTP